MVDGISGYFEILTNHPSYIAVALLVILIIGVIALLLIRRKRGNKSLTLRPRPGKLPESIENDRATILGQPGVNCIAIRNPAVLGYDVDINIIDFTTMPNPLGEIHFADTSCPVSGAIYTVIEKEDGSLIDYDPRQVPLNVETTPERAYQATHWPELPSVWGTPQPFYKNSSFWFAIGCIVILFFISMVAMGA